MRISWWSSGLGLGVVTAVAPAATVVQICSLAWELLHAMGMVKKSVLLSRLISHDSINP